MPDRLQDIYNTLEEIQAGGGLGGGGGTTDVSALATEVTLDSVVTNTAATTVAIGTLETNVITASGVQTLSLNSATSAQTTTLGTAIGGTTTAVGTVNTTLGTINTNLGIVNANITAVNTKLSADFLVQAGMQSDLSLMATDTSGILSNGLNTLAVIEADALEQVLQSAHLLNISDLLTSVEGLTTDIGSTVSGISTEVEQSRGRAKTLILESYRATPFAPTSPMNLGANLGLWNLYFNSQSIFTAVEVLNGGKCIKLTGYGEHWMPDSTFGDVVDHQVDKFIDEDGLFTSCGAGCLTQFSADSVISIPKMQTMGSGCLVPVFGTAPTHDTGMLDISSLVSAVDFMGGASAAGIYLTVKRNETFAKSAEYLAVKAIANFIEVPVGEESQILAELQGLKTSIDADALVQVNSNDILGYHLPLATTTLSNIEVSADITAQYLAAPITATQVSVAASVTSIILVNPNPSRRSLTIFNNSNAHLFICTSATATQATAICRIVPYGYYEMPNPVLLDIISGIWDSAHGNASIYEGV
jgi:hypothetical protein